jgi:hypothetical protein
MLLNKLAALDAHRSMNILMVLRVTAPSANTGHVYANGSTISRCR